jgi:uncharacterized protein (DUF1697 family)
MTTWIALLRGVNVGGAKKLPMARLRALAESLGYERVRTYVQSGNVVLDGPARDGADAVAKRLGEAIEAEFGFDVAIVVRSREELAAIVAANPYPDADEQPTALHVVLRSEAIDPVGVADVDQAAFAPEAFTIAGRELYLWTPGGIGRSKLAAKLTDRRLGGPATARNWRTVTRLLAMAGESA